MASVREGNEVVLKDGDEEVASVTPRPPKNTGARKPGSPKGQIHQDETFWDPLPEDEVRL